MTWLFFILLSLKLHSLIIYHRNMNLTYFFHNLNCFRGFPPVVIVCLLLSLSSCESDLERRIRLEQEAQIQRERAALEVRKAEEARFEAEQLRLEGEARLERIRIEQEEARLAEERRARLLDSSLNTGSRPFSECWRSGWSGDCEVKVTAAATHEVLVTVKRGDQDGPVVGHVYVAAGGTGKIQFASGTYQVFFSQGKGWDPDAVNPIRNCEEPAWFVDFYGVSKDEPDFYPEGQTYTYKLQPVQQGNFRAEGSDPNEAF